jgi:hypothetical protein
VADWLAEYSNRNTRERYEGSLRLVVRHANASTPDELTPAAVAAWADDYDGANNTVRGCAIRQNDTLSRNLRKRAAAAGLGWMAAHDLKRTAGRMMHEARSADGGHLFDTLG